MGRLFVVGSLNVDTVIRVQSHPKPGQTVLGGAPTTAWGGKGANQAIAAARSAPKGVGVSLVGRVGDDPEGTTYRERLRSLGIAVTAVLRTPDVRTGSAVVVVNEDGENMIIVSPAANECLGVEDLTALRSLDSTDVIVTNLEIPTAVVERTAEYCVRSGARLVLNLSPFAVVSPAVLLYADPVIVNEHEARDLESRYGQLPSVLITRGDKGSEWGANRVPALPLADVVDTTGAGDAYCGALAVALAGGATPVGAMHRATSAAAEAVRRHGAQ
ncbi:ribokinase [Tsukamurella soli]|uniref:Ribokinase n=2 Tax=Tsukamurella soli TaxID=644556 RepID=A0ABP8JGY0_9ACTN